MPERTTSKPSKSALIRGRPAVPTRSRRERPAIAVGSLMPMPVGVGQGIADEPAVLRLLVWRACRLRAVLRYGTPDRWLTAVQARIGEILWQFRMPSGMVGRPMSFLGADGQQ